MSIQDRLSELEELNARLTAALDEKTRAQQARAHADAHFRASFESAAVGQVHYDPVTGVIIRANRAYAAMLGYTPEELVGRLGSDFTYPADKERESYRRMISGAVEGYAREKRSVRRAGTPIWTRISASLVRHPDSGEPLLAMAIVEDVVERHKAQIALRQAKQDLEAVVEQRTTALAQRDLLLREVYHRVKNNLQIVDSMLLMQGRRLADPEAKTALDSLRARIFALGLVHHQLMGSKDLETIDIAPFLDELSRHLLAGEGEAGIRMSVTAEPLRIGLAVGIPLGLLATELVTNSIKHAFGGPEVVRSGAIEVALEAPAPGKVLLRVADNGCGYDAAAKDQAGVGVGLIRGLVGQMKGQLTISTEGGTCVEIIVPASGLP